MRRDDGFTLIELSIAIAIMLVVLTLAVPSLDGVVADRRLRRSLDDFNSMVRQAQERSIAERRSYLIVWRDGKIELQPEGVSQGEDPAPVATMALGRGESLNFTFPAAMMEDPAPEWVFWPSGNCEPAIVTYRSPNGAWTANYSALTARAEVLSYAAK